ncbi:MAG: DUF1579 domain-containing protein [Candidatus Aminicenantes bacterium]|nr:MAG: DUF1579 domain-containing protein [Candidatus Aminicenantes bacterium]
MKMQAVFTLIIAMVFLTPCFAQEESAAQMEKIEKLMKPGEFHELLKQFVGTWTADVKIWMEPNAPPVVTKGQADFKLIFDGRFLYGDFLGEFMGTPFKGINIMGYDNGKQEFFSIWIDNSNTGVLSSSGSYDAETKKYRFFAEMFDPVSGQTLELREEAYFASKDEYISITYAKLKDGEEFKNMEMKYTRVK